MQCHISGCVHEAVVRYEVTVRGRRMQLGACSRHREMMSGLVRDIHEEKALKREQAAERQRWGDPQKRAYA